MSTKNHTDITTGAPANAAVVNAPLGQLDNALADLELSFGDYVVSGGLAGTSASLVITQPATRAFVLNSWVNASGTSLTATATQDNYVDLDNAGVYHLTHVNNGATAPAVFANSIRLYKAVSSGTAVTSVTDLRATVFSNGLTLGGGLNVGTSMVSDPRLGAVAASIEATGSILTGGSLVLTANNAYLALYSTNFPINVQAGGPRNVALAATSTLTLPDLALGTATPASGYLMACTTANPAAGHGVKAVDTFGVFTDCGYPMSDPSVTTLVASGRGTFGAITVSGASPIITMTGTGFSEIIGGTAGHTFRNNANSADNLFWSDAGNAVLRGGVNIGGDAGSGTASQLGLTNVVGIGNGALTNMQAPLKGTGSGPTTATTVTDWIKVYDGTTVRWIPLFT